MSNTPIAFTLAQWQQVYRDGQSPAELLHALRRELRADDTAWIALASEAQLNAQLDALTIAQEGAGGDLSKLPSSVLMDPTQAIGKTLKSGLGAGQPLRSDQLAAQWAVQQGQTVRMISRGDGFSVSAEGKALTSAQEGQVVQVRAASGQTVSGIARAGGIVEVTH